MITKLNITGMTCGHCEMSVREELSEIDGVTVVSVDHTSGVAEISSDAPVDQQALKDAVAEAGYELASIGADSLD